MDKVLEAPVARTHDERCIKMLNLRLVTQREHNIAPSLLLSEILKGHYNPSGGQAMASRNLNVDCHMCLDISILAT